MKLFFPLQVCKDEHVLVDALESRPDLFRFDLVHMTVTFLYDIMDQFQQEQNLSDLMDSSSFEQVVDEHMEEDGDDWGNDFQSPETSNW